MSGIPPIPAYPMPTRAELPRRIPTWEPDPDRVALLVHDMQHYFLAPFRGAQLRELLTNVTALVTGARALGVPVLYTAQPGSMTPDERGLLAAFWGRGMQASEAERRIADPIAPREDEAVLTKWRYSAFARTDLDARLEATGRDQLIVCGVYAHVGILTTAVDAFSRDLETFVVADAVADFDRAGHTDALERAAATCAVVTDTVETLDALGARPRALLARTA